MKSLRRYFTMLLCVIVLMSNITVVRIEAAPTTSDELQELYNTTLVNCKAISTYGTPCQPNSALFLLDGVITELTPGNISPNYRGGVIDLPRLSADYYYELDTTSTGFELGNTTYPTLLLYGSSYEKTVKLTIRNKDTHEVMPDGTFMLKNVGITDGVDYWYSGQPIMDSDGSSEMYPGATFEDCSSSVLSSLVSGPAYKVDTITHCYDAGLHKSSIVMPNYIYTTKGVGEVTTNVTINAELFTTVNIDELSYHFYRKAVGMDALDSFLNVKDYMTTNLYGTNGNSRPALLVTGSKTKDCYYNSTLGQVKTRVTKDDANVPLYYAIAANGECYFGCVDRTTIDTSEYTEAIGNTNMVWNADRYYSLEDGVVLSSGGLSTVTEDDKVKFSYGPVNFDSFWSTVSDKYEVNNRRGRYEFMHENDAEDMEGMNVYAETLMFSGCATHLANAKLLKRPYKLNFKYYIQKPNSNVWSYMGTAGFPRDNFTMDMLMGIPEAEYYTPTEWCTDTDCTKPFSMDTIANPKNYTLDLYAKYTYTGGNYTVKFYNDVTQSETSATFKVNELPALPATPVGKGGYKFKNYEVFEDSLNGKSLGMFNADTFKPVENKTYVFKTCWSVAGAIVNVSTSKIDYFVGEEIDKALLDVTVQESDDINDTRRLNPVEFSVANGLVNKPGEHMFYVTYLATGSIGDCVVNGVEVVPEKIIASYNGGDVPVGTALEASNFVVKAVYNNGDQKQVTDFTTNPSKISDVGTTNVTVTWGKFSTTVKVKGYSPTDKPDTSDKKKEPKLKSISASYIGPTVYVNDYISNASIQLKAKYSDKSTKIIASNLYSISPNYSSYTGELVIRVSYGGLTTSCKVNVYEHEDDDDGRVVVEDNKPTDSSTNSKPSSSSNGSASNTGNTDSNNTTTSNGNSSSSSNTSSGGSVGSDKGNSSTSSKDKDDKEKGASPYYIHGATILTNVTGQANATEVEKVDVMKLIKDASASVTSLDVTLVNGVAGNDITLDMLKELKSKLIQLNITMVSPSDRTAKVAEWTIYGSSLESGNIRPLNPNITFEKDVKDTDTVLFMAPQNQAYTTGVTLSLYPEVAAYNSGESVTLYSCDNNKGNAQFVKSLIWQDVPIEVPVDVLSTRHYAFSNAPMTYPQGASLLSTIGNVSISENSIDSDSDFTFEYEEEWDWGEETEDTSEDVEDPLEVSKDIVEGANKIAGLTGITLIVTTMCSLFLLIVTIWALCTKPKPPEDFS